MIVEDEKDIRFLFKKIFSPEYKVLTVHSGEEAIDIFKKQDPEIAIIDYHLPGIDGIETIKRIKRINNKCEFIIISSPVTIHEIRSRGEMLGVKHCFSKPFKLDKIKKAIKEVLSPTGQT